MNEIEHAAQRVLDVERQVSDHVARTGPVLGRASSSDGAVTVVTAPGGPPQQVQVSPAALHMGPHALAAEILRVAERASRDASAKLHRSLERIVAPGDLTALGFAPGQIEDEDFGWRR